MCARYARRMDVLTDRLTRAQARGAVFAHSTLRGPWGLRFVDDLPLSIHAVLEGELWVQLGDDAPVGLLQGDVLLIRSDRPYAFTHAPGAPAEPLPPAPPTGGAKRFDMGPPGAPRTVLLCGAYAFHGNVCDSLLASVPELLPLRGAGLRDEAMRDALGLLARDVLQPRPGGQAVLDRLLDLLLVYVLRAWFSSPEAVPPPWYSALDDPEVGASLQLIHERPEQAWTVADLAAQVGLSRATLARRFAAAVGEAPLSYLTRWRMAIAGEALLEPGATIASVAPTVGYGSEFAFAAAFKRHHGVAPGRWRSARRGRAGEAAAAT